jgi:thiosulfate/3-mercaptopyruvate sulfurtransferase
MAFETIISAQTLVNYLDHPDWVIIDCRFDLDNPETCRLGYNERHLPNAQYAHLLEDLCAKPIDGVTSRHPFPTIEAFSARLSAWGINEKVQVVVYDDQDGGFAVRLWRMLGWLGHRAVALLDGGLNKWIELGYPIQTGSVSIPGRVFVPQVRPELIVDSQTAVRLHNQPEFIFLDTRSSRSYTGAKDPTSPACGHIPRAKHLYYTENLGKDGLLLPIDELLSRYHQILSDRPAERVIAYCTSGVTASLNILVMQHLGLGEGRLYAGSWDEWVSDPARPVEKSLPSTLVIGRQSS